jgi:hypothetical protein
MTDFPGNPHGLLLVLRSATSEMGSQGVELTICDNGMIRVQTVAAAYKEHHEEARLRIAFDSALPEAAALRREFGSFERFVAYKRGVSAGQIIPPRRAQNVIDSGRNTHPEVDSRLTVEARCRQIWETDPDIRSEFGNLDRYVAFEKANAAGQVQQFALGA